MSSLRKGRKLLVVIFAFALLAAACGDDDDSGDEGGGTTTTPDTVTDVPEGGTVTYASDQEPTGWNVNTANDNLAALNYMTILVYPQAFDTTPEFEVVMNKDLLDERGADQRRTADDRVRDQPGRGLVGRHAHHRQGLHLQLEAPERQGRRRPRRERSRGRDA